MVLAFDERMKIKRHGILLFQSFLLLGYGCSDKEKTTTVNTTNTEISEERITTLEKRLRELEASLEKNENTPLEYRLNLKEIEESIEKGTFSVKTDTIFYEDDAILNFGPELRISSTDGKLLSDINQTIFGGDMIVHTTFMGSKDVTITITDGFIERDGEKVKIEVKKPGTFKIEKMSNKAVLTMPEAAPPAS